MGCRRYQLCCFKLGDAACWRLVGSVAVVPRPVDDVCPSLQIWSRLSLPPPPRCLRLLLPLSISLGFFFLLLLANQTGSAVFVCARFTLGPTCDVVQELVHTKTFVRRGVLLRLTHSYTKRTHAQHSG